MSLFENDDYEWRETYFVLFESEHRPSSKSVVAALNQLGRQFEISNVTEDERGLVESLTVVAYDDYAAMDISYVDGEEVTEQISELCKDLADLVGSDEERKLLGRLPECSARLDIFHFERQIAGGKDGEAEEYFMDPGGLISVLQKLGSLCNGIPIDPQTGIVV